jgi:hypothetical protein
VNDKDFHVSPAQNKKLPKAVSETTAQKRKANFLKTLSAAWAPPSEGGTFLCRNFRQVL